MVESKEPEESPQISVKPGCTLFVKNLNFETTEETLKNVRKLSLRHDNMRSISHVYPVFFEFRRSFVLGRLSKLLLRRKKTWRKKVTADRFQRTSLYMIDWMLSVHSDNLLRSEFSGEMLSMGYGFVDFESRESTNKALKMMQHKDIDGHAVELKISTRDTQYAVCMLWWHESHCVM